MAAALIVDPSLLCSLLPPATARCSLSAPGGKLRLDRKPSLLPVVSPCAPAPCPCAAGTLDPDPADESPAPSLSSRADGREGGKDRRRVVRIAWEKLVRWSRSWRSKSRGDVLERTKKIVVLGGGSFGTAMAAHAACRKADMEVAMLLRDDDVCRAINGTHFNCKYFPEHKLPENIVATTSAKDALLGADFCLHAVPVQFSVSSRHFTTCGPKFAIYFSKQRVGTKYSKDNVTNYSSCTKKSSSTFYCTIWSFLRSRVDEENANSNGCCIKRQKVGK